jgi:hypothetical protein
MSTELKLSYYKGDRFKTVALDPKSREADQIIENLLRLIDGVKLGKWKETCRTEPINGNDGFKSE